MVILYSIPLIVAVSLVYSASRYEPPVVIATHAVKTAGWIVGLMGAIYLILAAATTLL
ncbi:MAG: hypothetical protein R3C10_07410 [Pirellulales bacterium]|nr:hypothetical protein [Planctomycetales bacterium]